MTNFISFTEAAGVPIHYDRLDPPNHYGTKGKGPRTVRGMPIFKKLLDAWMTDLSTRCPWGKPELLCTAGFQVDKGNERNAHRRGMAFDLDSLWWPGQPPMVAILGTEDPRYLAIEAGLRRHFGVVLGYHYNRQHRDHFHVDCSRPVGWSPQSKQRVLFVQAAARYLFGQDLELDGKWGPATRAGVMAIMGAAVLPALFSPAIWADLLDRVEHEGVRQALLVR